MGVWFVCMYCPHGVALLCCRQTIDPKAHLLVVRAAFLSMHADGDGDCDSVCSLLL